MARIVQGALDVDVQVIPLFEGSVQLQHSDFRPHASLSEERDRVNRVRYLVRRLYSISYSEIEHAVNLYFHVVLGDSSLRLDL